MTKLVTKAITWQVETLNKGVTNKSKNNEVTDVIKH